MTAVLIGLLGVATTGVWIAAYLRERTHRIHAERRERAAQRTATRLRAELDAVTAELNRGWTARDRRHRRPSPDAIAMEAPVLADIAALPSTTDPRRPEQGEQ